MKTLTHCRRRLMAVQYERAEGTLARNGRERRQK
jgi:hypothetical protein